MTEEKKQEAPAKKEKSTKEDKKDKVSASSADKKVPAKFKDLVKKIEELSVLDLAELVKILEEKFGVSAVPMATAPVGGTAAAGGGEAGAAEEKSSFTVELTSAGDQKIAAIKIIKEITGLGLKEAKDLVDGAPKVIKEDVKKEEAEDIKKKLEEVGAGVQLK